MLERLFADIGAELGVSISRYSFGKWQNHEYRAGDLTYNYDSAFQVTVCVWLDSISSRCAPTVESPTPIVTPDQEEPFQERLRAAVESLLPQQEMGGSRG